MTMLLNSRLPWPEPWHTDQSPGTLTSAHEQAGAITSGHLLSCQAPLMGLVSVCPASGVVIEAQAWLRYPPPPAFMADSTEPTPTQAAPKEVGNGGVERHA